MSAEGLDELEMKLNQLADIDLKKAVSEMLVQTVQKRSCYECACRHGRIADRVFMQMWKKTVIR